VRAVNPTVPLSLFVICSVGDDERTRSIASLLGDTFMGGFFGDPAKVADSIRALGAEGISGVQVSPFNEGAFELLAHELRR
jgi:hypothetical protein